MEGCQLSQTPVKAWAGPLVSIPYRYYKTNFPYVDTRTLFQFLSLIGTTRPGATTQNRCGVYSFLVSIPYRYYKTKV